MKTNETREKILMKQFHFETFVGRFQLTKQSFSKICEMNEKQCLFVHALSALP